MKSATLLACVVLAASALAAEPPHVKPWQLGDPIVTYWAGPPMSDAVCKQMTDAAFNVVWCNEKDLDLLQRHNLRGLLHDPLLNPGTIETPDGRAKLDALIQRVRKHPAMYGYFITDEPSAKQFPGLGKLFAYLKERDPAHFAYLNLFPTYASNEQLGTTGDTVTAYKEHLRQYVEIVKPQLISYDHYQFYKKGDTKQYFLNLAMIRRASQDAGVPFLNIIQASAWSPDVRVPTADETRYLVYTTLAYGARGVSYYVYYAPGHEGMIVDAKNNPTPIYEPLKTLNREFLAIARELTATRSLAIYHTTMREKGCEPLPADLPFKLEQPAAAPDPNAKPGDAPRGLLLALFGQDAAKPTHALVVNLDYKGRSGGTLTAPGNVELFNPATGEWMPANAAKVHMTLLSGGGQLFRLR